MFILVVCAIVGGLATNCVNKTPDKTYTYADCQTAMLAAWKTDAKDVWTHCTLPPLH